LNILSQQKKQSNITHSSRILFRKGAVGGAEKAPKRAGWL